MEDLERDEAQREAGEQELERKLQGPTMLQASCLGLGLGKWGSCNWCFGRGKAILCWDEKRGHKAPLYRYLVTAHDFCCSEWRLNPEREPTINLLPGVPEATETMNCPTCGSTVTLYLQRDEPTGQEYWEGACKNCQAKWTRI